MFQRDGTLMDHYVHFHNRLNVFSSNELKEKHELAQQSFLRQGITFTVYQDNTGTERTMPFDFIPIIIPPSEWKRIEKGMIQRTNALNLFLEDIYHHQRILHDGVIPKELVYNNNHYYSVLRHLPFPIQNHIFLAGIDLIRDEHGQYCVLEDNLRNPSGLSYVYQNRFVMRQVYPEFFQSHSLYTLENQLMYLREAIMDYKPQNHSGSEATAVLLTPGIYNSAYYDHVFLAQKMGIELVEGSDLVVKDHKVYMKTIYGPERVDIIYRRIDDDYLDPLTFRKESLLGVPGLFNAFKAGNVSILNAIGNGVADDKAMYAYVPDMIRYYLQEEPIIPNVKTYFLDDPEQRQWVLDRLDQLVIKNVGASGGYDMLIGPHANEEELILFREKIIAKPHQYIAQPTIKLSRAPAYQNEQFYPCHIDLRVFVMSGEKTHVIPGGLSRVALKKGSLVVNSSQGGGGKDTWVLKT
ncbi:circularly permuted type 2 ATP-grasp protein [Alkalicoccobacillus porphyridii]|uniref:Circularly permuted type 2 ATP-grasp protein n=1 Tax=Alkalicoccobacillus porphyridii TaxID=2597270 RepID=A0A553ZW23_9BACI|nr:circularly permuted type 2 ATP-grasp protein [Alkalicoccobacillus porphyridii]TSB45516.1 circularly permuted type 2 ATP-grasp protein [Alkalicoccobacillus porphyridii]